ncbi:AraC family transcriptional regulator [Paraburkholderia ribeironis]|uniref:AraC family transcriptional regulator n=1 Tax=Paraburkholderia ribeironis TaxID=1247936 RepID=A0A1N7SBB6_9BURK|nr:AraC family transcriptional regulator [Paraburkholderia ribeironis]SIT44621.1 AraC family transcriptional regulator [Paraburkholderia ribeironis]
MDPSTFEWSSRLGLEASNGGLFVSRGAGGHPSRIIPSYELIYVKHGTLHLHERGVPFEVSAGETLLLWPGRQHGGTAPFAPGLQFYWVHFTTTEPERRFGSVTQRQQEAPLEPVLRVSQHARIERPDHLTGLFQRLLNDQEIYGIQPCPDALTILLMLWEITRSHDANAGADGAPQRLAASADRLIRTHFHQAVSASSIAHQLGCNADYLGRIFRSVYGKTLTDAVHERRILYAATLMADGHLTIDQVARQSGFEDSGYFRRIFKRSKGMTPNAFRRLHLRLHVNTA